MEMWKSIKGYEGLYEVSDAGRIRRIGYGILKPWRERNGYIHIRLFKNGIGKTMLIHRVVAIAFLGDPVDGSVVNHINCNPSDNRASNLEWTSQSENVKYAYKLGRADNAARKKIVCVDNGKAFCSSMEAAVWLNGEKFHDSKNLNTVSRTIRQCANHERGHRKAYGLNWKFCDNEGSTTIP